MYSLVAHSRSKKKIISIADFFTTAHDQLNISKYLSKIKHNLDQNSICYPKVIVTDQSMALINAIMISFNNCNLQNYN